MTAPKADCQLRDFIVSEIYVCVFSLFPGSSHRDVNLKNARMNSRRDVPLSHCFSAETYVWAAVIFSAGSIFGDCCAPRPWESAAFRCDGQRMTSLVSNIYLFSSGFCIFKRRLEIFVPVNHPAMKNSEISVVF